ncbi:MAG TPA: protein YgfX [Burkholderiales bacterium]|jgi:hypothetical protein|nr:protein YgfX [Burkholderiales bacterium]
MDMPLLAVTLSRSAWLAAALAGVHGLAAACAVLYAPQWAGMPGWGWRTLALAALAASLARHLRRDAWLAAPGSVTGVALREDGGCELTLGDGSIRSGAVAGSSFVSAVLVALVVRLEGGGVRSVALLPDSAPADDRRRLRAWLRLRLPPPTSART